MNVVLRVRSQQFGSDSGVCCTGCQLAKLATAVENHFRGVVWYTADVMPNQRQEFSDSYELRPIGSTSSLIEESKGIAQFERGVFSAFMSTTSRPNVRKCVATDDDIDVDLGNSLLEIRAFDCSFFEVIARRDFPFEDVFKDLFSRGEIAVQTE